MAGKRKPWDRQNDETDEGFDAFKVYRDMGSERTLNATANETGYSMRQCAEFSRKFRWVSRAGAWERRKDQARTNATLTEIERMHSRHTRLALKLQDFTAIELERIIRHRSRLLEYNKSGELTSGNELAKVAERAVKMERLSRGEVTERVETSFDLSKLSVGELRELKRLRAKMGAATEGDEDGESEADE